MLWRCDVNAIGTVLDFELLSQCSMVWPCVVEMLWGPCWILSCCLNVQWCGHVCRDVRVMGTVLDFELLSQCSMVWPCCRDVVFNTWVRCWILSCCLNVQWCGHVLWRCDVNAMGTVLDFELLSQCSMTWPCGVEM